MKVFHKTVLKGHASAVYCLDRGEDSEVFYSGSADRMVGAWKVSGFRPDTFSVKLEEAVFSIHKSDGKLLIGQGGGGVHVLDLFGKKEIRHLKYHDRPVFGILENPVQQLVYFFGGDGKLSIVDSRDYSLRWSLEVSNDKLRCGVLDLNGDYLLLGSSDGYLRSFDTQYYNLTEDICAHQGGLYGLEWLDKETLITVGRDGHIRIWKYSKGLMIELDAIPAHNYAVYSVQMAPTKKYFATSSRDRTIKIWKTNDLRNPIRIERKKGVGHTHSVNALIWLRDNLLVSAGDDRDIHVWSIQGS